MSCSLVFRNQPSGPLPEAQIINYDDNSSTADATGSTGVQVRVTVTRNGIIIETTAGEPNTGDNQISINTDVQNGDRICVQATNNDFFYYDQNCLTIPTPEFGFVPVG